MKPPTRESHVSPETRNAAGPVPRRAVTLAVLCAGMFLVLLDVTIVNVALPGIGRALGAGPAGLQGVVDGYAVAIAGLLLGGGALADRVGHRATTLLGLGLFGVASLACGAAPGAGALIAARAVQGAGAALFLPGSLALIAAMYPGRAEQARALGMWAGVSSTALPAGPLLGGALVDSAGWRWIFLLNAPIVAAAVAGVLVLVRDPGTRRGGAPLDRAGMMLAPLALGGLVWTVIAAGHGHARTATVAAVVAVAAGAAFAVAERRAAAPMLPGGLLRAPAFLGANGIALIMNLVTNGVLFVATLLLQQAGGRSAFTAGAMLLPMAVPLALLAPVGGRLTARFGPRLPLVAGTAIAAAGCLSLLRVGAASHATSYGALLPTLAAIGIGDGLIVTAVVAAAMRTAPPGRAGLAGGFNNTARQVGTALGVAVYGSVAGSALRPERFASGLHALAWVSVALWVAALALTWLVPAPSPRRRRDAATFRRRTEGTALSRLR
ncbi:MFS transporter [Actinomadura meridiana]|uniref:MFS transporter n=1 Tax=Actinomadura meridiana TaxID=559626 RepID=A0ABP8BUP9_9ACTN